jgi:hypothetical protein
MTIEINFKNKDGRIIMSWYENKNDEVPAELDEQLLIAVNQVLDEYNNKIADEAVEEPYSDLVKFYNRI